MPAADRATTPAAARDAAYVTTPGRSRNMAAIRRVNTKPEIALRSALHREGCRFRKDYAVRINGKLIRPDIAFPKRKVAIFIDGCFWHCCPDHGRQPSVNGEYWSPKLAGNVERDERQTSALEQAGWRVVRFWEHESVDQMVKSVIGLLQSAPRASG
ncbi:very short patch repair endonuclease [Mycobacterium sp. 236(2023)]|uniref:very short patch repair endonuclease n=1 Tax=Mycobacterium sp. 236(2023) TaxID=3038163 RepID=UPI00241585EB|nr:very short patch repair endonuclease [Mycobacterium sp. 236(2023)]MDG4668627.1 very short patch repair endonuclease [Mycobacterium sp. 236(2023)]